MLSLPLHQETALTQPPKVKVVRMFPRGENAGEKFIVLQRRLNHQSVSTPRVRDVQRAFTIASLTLFLAAHTLLRQSLWPTQIRISPRRPGAPFHRSRRKPRKFSHKKKTRAM